MNSVCKTVSMNSDPKTVHSTVHCRRFVVCTVVRAAHTISLCCSRVHATSPTSPALLRHQKAVSRHQQANPIPTPKGYQQANHVLIPKGYVATLNDQPCHDRENSVATDFNFALKCCCCDTKRSCRDTKSPNCPTPYRDTKNPCRDTE